MTENVKKQWKHLLREGVITTVAAFLVLGLIRPFGIDRIEDHPWRYVFCESMLVFLSFFVSQTILMLFPAYRRFCPKTIWQDALRIALLYMMMTPLLAACLISFNYVYCGAPLAYAWHSPDGSFTLVPFLEMWMWVAIISLFMMIFELYRLRNAHLQQELLDIKAINALLEARQQQLADAHDKADATAASCDSDAKSMRLSLRGNAQNAHLSLYPDDIIYIESMANYADIVYIDGGTTRHSTLRITLKQLREQLATADYLVQCHRAFLVNLNFVRSLSVRSAGCYELELFGLDKRIPVSRANADQMKQYLEK